MNRIVESIKKPFKDLSGYINCKMTEYLNPNQENKSEGSDLELINTQRSTIEWQFDRATQNVTGNPIIIEIQGYLKIMAFPIGNYGPNKNGIDGVMGDSTQSAIKAFQLMTRQNVDPQNEEQVAMQLEKAVFSGNTIRSLAVEALKAGVDFEISNLSTRAEFVNALYYDAIIDEINSKVPAAVTVAQAILESVYGKFIPVDIQTGQYSYNLFGIKGTGPAGSVKSWTREENKKTGVWEPQLARFKAFNSFVESIKGHSDFFYQNLRRYSAAFKTSNPADFAKAIAKAGYATDSQYANKLINLMKTWGMIAT